MLNCSGSGDEEGAGNFAKFSLNGVRNKVLHWEISETTLRMGVGNMVIG